MVHISGDIESGEEELSRSIETFAEVELCKCGSKKKTKVVTTSIYYGIYRIRIRECEECKFRYKTMETRWDGTRMKEKKNNATKRRLVERVKKLIDLLAETL
jgi:transcriptional regulator NrdR family protein